MRELIRRRDICARDNVIQRRLDMVDPFQTIDHRPALDGNPARHLLHVGMRNDKLDWHIEHKFDAVTGLPYPVNLHVTIY